VKHEDNNYPQIKMKSLSMQQHLMTFEQAITELKAGKQIYRTGWQGSGDYIYLREKISPMQSPTLWVKKHHPETEYWPWVPTQIDIFKDDWQIR
jgi:hypothetical protein